jgi:hypothetical protein
MFSANEVARVEQIDTGLPLYFGGQRAMQMHTPMTGR